MDNQRTCCNCKNYLKYEKKPKVKLYPACQELTCHVGYIDEKV